MIFNRKGSTTIITQEKTTIIEFVQGLEKKYNSIKNDNIIVDLFSLKDLSVRDLQEFLLVSNQHKAQGHSFVIVTEKISYEDAHDDITIVPTLQEAYDIVEMEEIERDLGF